MVNFEYMNKANEYFVDGEETTIELGELSRFDDDQYDLSDDRDFTKYVADVERIVRNSFEYRWLVQNLKRIGGMDECAVMEGASSRDGSGIKIELHHSPMTLYDITMAVIRKRIKNNEDMSIYAVCKEILYNHYLKHVGLVPLCQTVHEMVHNSFYFIPTDKVFGDYKPFKESYYNYLDPEVLDAIDNAEEATKNNLFSEQNQLFNNHNIYIQPKNYDLNNIQNARGSIRDRVDIIKNNVPQAQQQYQFNQPVALCYIVDNSKPRTYQ